MIDRTCRKIWRWRCDSACGSQQSDETPGDGHAGQRVLLLRMENKISTRITKIEEKGGQKIDLSRSVRPVRVGSADRNIRNAGQRSNKGRSLAKKTREEILEQEKKNYGRKLEHTGNRGSEELILWISKHSRNERLWTSSEQIGCQDCITGSSRRGRVIRFNLRHNSQRRVCRRRERSQTAATGTVPSTWQMSSRSSGGVESGSVWAGQLIILRAPESRSAG
jgi:hypothetical protein